MAYATAWRLLANASDAEDAVQEAFAEAVRLDRRTAVENWGGLLRRLVVCRALDLARKRRKQEALSEQITAPSPQRPEAVAVGRELAERLRSALTELPPREAEVFAMRYLTDLGNVEIADALGLTAGAVGVALHKARQRLEMLLQDNEDKHANPGSQ
jgi:RNA polymerase sigma-70 factor (ECF subfamily)